MTRIQTSITALALSGVVGLSGIVAPVAAGASEEGKRNTAIALGALAVGVLLSQQSHHNDYCDDGRYREPAVVYHDSYRYDGRRDDHRDRDDYRDRRDDHGSNWGGSSYRRNDGGSNWSGSNRGHDNSQRQGTWSGGGHRGGR